MLLALGEGTCSLVTQIKAARAGVDGGYLKKFCLFQRIVRKRNSQPWK